MLVKSRLELVSWDEELLEKFPIEHPLAKASVRYKAEQMSTVTFRLSEDEKEFMQKMAEFNGLSLSELARTKILESLEDQIDLDTYNKLMNEHRIKDESISHAEMMKELGL